MVSKKSDVAIKVSGVSKVFKLPNEQQNSLKGRIVNFRKRGYEVQKALNDVSFEVKKGEFFGIVGRNGSGKSTLLKILAGIYTPTSGSVAVNGKLTPFIELGVGFNPELSGRDNVFLNGALLGFNRKEMLAMYDDIVEFAEIERFMDQKLKNYSSGMQVRLAFSIAIRANTDILVLDEVLAVGDESFQRKCFAYFKQLKKDKKTVILVTHDMGAAKKFCDRAILLDKGAIVATGSPDEVTNQYTLENLAKISGNKETSINVPWITIEPQSKPVLNSKDELKCKIVYYSPDDIPVGFGISIIDSATNRSTSVIDDGIVNDDGKRQITSDKKGRHSFNYSLQLKGFNNRDFEITAVLFQYMKDYDEFIPYAFIEEGNIARFAIRGGKSDNGLLKLKGKWQ